MISATTQTSSDPHASGQIFHAGPPVERAAGAIILIHGRGASAEDIISLYDQMDAPDFAAIAPQATDYTWYPQRFTAPIELNQPYLDSALNRIKSLVDDLLQRGVKSERIVIGGFSQGACLTTEFVARNPRRYGGVLGLSGGLIGPPGTRRDYPGELAGTPVLLGCSDVDPHIPWERVEETATVLQRMGAKVDLRQYPGMPHTVNQDEMDACRGILRTIQR